ncbi:MAG: peptidoglycan DD-metalloendopeptidase family protein [Bacteroidales bacterium]|nr:peptidoglycan DD-metalloendopeptidase family protein [Bacteroidales bacterium]MBQ8811293.1 peptidoglycan DD-metalloendopeptidase family protein [Bacteroidales bacterium]
MHRNFIIFICCFAAASCGRNAVSDNDRGADVEQPAIVTELTPAERMLDNETLEDIFGIDTLRCVEGKVKNGQFFSTLLEKLGLTAREAYDLAQAVDSVFNPRNLRVGNPYKAYYGEESLQYIVYDQYRGSQIIFRCQPPYEAWEYNKPVTIEQRYADVTIQNSLWVDMTDAGVSPLLVVDLSDIYAWTVDFFGLQKGDRFKVLYEEKICDGEVIAIDTVRYAVFTHAGQDYPMVMYNAGDGGNIWWNEKGESMRKAFLKAPLKFSRISSGFSYARRHPVTRKIQPHTGVDYAAPKGTPVMSIGDGVVTSMKYEGAGGNTVRITHNSVYKTAYLHLSKYGPGLKVGQRVRQGQVIGYVGSTGRSTGPHLDFRVWKNGTPINPLKMDSPPAEPLKPEYMEAFAAAREASASRIDTIRASSAVTVLFDLL